MRNAETKIFYTDGSCKGIDGPGGWCYVELVPCCAGYCTSIVTGNKKVATNHEMELYAVYRAIARAYEEGAKSVKIFCDSKYVVNAIGKKWLKGWTKNGYKTMRGSDVQNQNIWKNVAKLIYGPGSIKVHMFLIKGHSGDPLNELADEQAVEARRGIEDEDR